MPLPLRYARYATDIAIAIIATLIYYADMLRQLPHYAMLHTYAVTDADIAMLLRPIYVIYYTHEGHTYDWYMPDITDIRR